MPRRRLSLIACVSIAALLTACSDAAPDAALAETAAVSKPDAAPVQKASSDGHAHGRDERPLPAFSGLTLGGEERSISEFIGQRLLLVFFNPEVAESAHVADAVARLVPERGRHNFEIVGVSMGSNRTKTREFAAEHGLEFEILDDSSARISRKLGMRSPLAVIGVDPEGFLAFGIGAFPKEGDDPVGLVEAQLREKLRLPASVTGSLGDLDQRPLAPDFSAPRLDGDERFELSANLERGVILVFFLHTCPHCHHALQFFKQDLAKMPEDKRPLLVGLSVQDRRSEVRASLKEDGLDFFPVIFDPAGDIQAKYGVFGGVPDIMLIDPQGRIAHRIQGWAEGRDPAIARMYAAKISGQPIPMLLNPKGYTGNDVCGVCHTTEHATWEFTSHAYAFDTLVAHGDDRDGECVSCHVVGFDQPGGYTLAERPAHLENVGCETCHGRGGPHLSPDHVKNGDYSTVCGSCHNKTHSLGFDFATFSPKISHAAIAAMTSSERETLLADRGKPRNVLPTNAALVGSDACQSCHAAEFATWEKSPHGHAVTTLEAKGEAANEECLVCHTTAFGREGGFPKGGSFADHPDMARVGCESCHGPGGNHVAEGSRKLGSIVSLGDKCDSCVILQICGSCHDEANDPGFRFKVEERIESQRHGTIEAGTGAPIGPSASRLDSPEQALAHAFAHLDSRDGG